ncbi:MAG TPA: gas vesicle protein GvpG [Vicinamibacteria bacterium]|nr:gas vesicle protein GvpG [Vicinamibacteria bacterium]
MILLDSLLLGGIRFVLDKLATAVDRELNDETHLREQLLDAQMRLELGEIGEEEFARLEADVLARLREVRERQRGASDGLAGGDYKVTGVEATFVGDEHDEG